MDFKCMYMSDIRVTRDNKVLQKKKSVENVWITKDLNGGRNILFKSYS